MKNPVPENGPGFLGLTSSLKMFEGYQKDSEVQNGPEGRGSDIEPVSTSSAGTGTKMDSKQIDPSSIKVMTCDTTLLGFWLTGHGGPDSTVVGIFCSIPQVAIFH